MSLAEPKIILFIVAGLLLSSCTYRVEKGSPQSLKPISASGLKAFERSVYAYVRRDCVGCHGERQHPRFAQEDSSAAYQLARLYVDFKDVSQSTLVFRTKNAHCGSKCQTDGSAMTDAIRRWWSEGEKEQEGELAQKTGVTLSAKRIPQSLGTGLNYSELDWPLSTLGKGFQDAHFTIEVQRFDGLSYRFRKPRLRSGESSLQVRRIRVLINGIFDPASSTFTEIDQTAATGSAPVLSSSSLIALLDKPKTDEVSIAFDLLKPVAGSVSCRNLAGFQSEVRPLIESHCFRCHADSTTKEYSIFPMSDDDARLCSESRQRSDLSFAMNSALIRYPLAEANEHPVRVLENSEAETIEHWILSEKK